MKNWQRHIVFLTPGFAQRETDTTTIPAISIYIKALKINNPELKITIISFHYPFDSKPYTWFGCDVISLNGKNKRVKKPWLYRNSWQLLSRVHKNSPIHLIHSFWLGECAFIGQWFSKRNHIKHLTTLMGQDVLKGNIFGKMLPLQKMIFISLSDLQQKLFKENYAIESIVIPWGINPTDFSEPRPKIIDFINVGSLNKIKNQEEFIKIVFEINQKQPVKALIIGEGKERKHLQQKIQLLNLESVIELKGLCSYQETLSYISQSKILIHTSNYESFGIIFAEALQCKTKIVSKNVGAAYENENWFIGTDSLELINGALNFLKLPFFESDGNPFLIEKTLEQYLKIYYE
ncbi:glycosyltransferase [Flavobacterium sp.]|uniref:glycosyltransferase n=1 Tax=Flavobacterium sp. TaxID=239 RepID=UPI0039190321